MLRKYKTNIVLHITKIHFLRFNNKLNNMICHFNKTKK